jgi:hypothetical protein
MGGTDTGRRARSPARAEPPRFMRNTENATRMGFPAVGVGVGVGVGVAAPRSVPAGFFRPWSTREPPHLRRRKAAE